eukprot:CAMPEP_0117437106 /NCGR_PEP_ID=MMETSP0759-20121206/1350_1 /TAXON_ID=63605 /ORGANISM="Percolomonas cosmopolitus, Strain WS" /LENGTH=2379 /DNA_ID=CAMNT_0005228723 /DNA_START=127 /DNA_END=7266 /DNA_ORIENTATION=+
MARNSSPNASNEDNESRREDSSQHPSQLETNTSHHPHQSNSNPSLRRKKVARISFTKMQRKSNQDDDKKNRESASVDKSAVSSSRDSWSLSLMSTESEEIRQRLHWNGTNDGLVREASLSDLDSIEERTSPAQLHDSSLLDNSQLSMISKDPTRKRKSSASPAPQLSEHDAMLREAKRISIIAKSKPQLAQQLLDKNPDFPEHIRERIMDPGISPDTLVEEEKRRVIQHQRQLDEKQHAMEERKKKQEAAKQQGSAESSDPKRGTISQPTVTAHKKINPDPPKDHLVQHSDPNRMITNMITTDHLVKRNQKFKTKGYQISGPRVNTRVNIVGFFAQKKNEVIQQTLKSNLQQVHQEKEKIEKPDNEPRRFMPQKLYEAPPDAPPSPRKLTGNVKQFAQKNKEESGEAEHEDAHTEENSPLEPIVPEPERFLSHEQRRDDDVSTEQEQQQEPSQISTSARTSTSQKGAGKRENPKGKKKVSKSTQPEFVQQSLHAEVFIPPSDSVSLPNKPVLKVVKHARKEKKSTRGMPAVPKKPAKKTTATQKEKVKVPLSQTTSSTTRKSSVKRKRNIPNKPLKKRTSPMRSSAIQTQTEQGEETEVVVTAISNTVEVVEEISMENVIRPSMVEDEEDSVLEGSEYFEDMLTPRSISSHESTLLQAQGQDARVAVAHEEVKTVDGDSSQVEMQNETNMEVVSKSSPFEHVTTADQKMESVVSPAKSEKQNSQLDNNTTNVMKPERSSDQEQTANKVDTDILQHPTEPAMQHDKPLTIETSDAKPENQSVPLVPPKQADSPEDKESSSDSLSLFGESKSSHSWSSKSSKKSGRKSIPIEIPADFIPPSALSSARSTNSTSSVRSSSKQEDTVVEHEIEDIVPLVVKKETTKQVQHNLPSISSKAVQGKKVPSQPTIAVKTLPPIVVKNAQKSQKQTQPRSLVHSLPESEDSEHASSSESETSQQSDHQERGFPLASLKKYNHEVDSLMKKAKGHFSQAAEQYDVLMHETAQRVTSNLSKTAEDVSRSMSISVTKFNNQFSHLQVLTKKTMNNIGMYSQLDQQVSRVMKANLANMEKLSSQMIQMEHEAEDKMRKFNEQMDERQRARAISNAFGSDDTRLTLQEFQKQFNLSPPTWEFTKTTDGEAPSAPLLAERLKDIHKLTQQASNLRFDARIMMGEMEMLKYQPLDLSAADFDADDELKINVDFDNYQMQEEEPEALRVSQLPPHSEAPSSAAEKIFDIDPALLQNLPKDINLEELKERYPEMVGRVLNHSLLNFQPVHIDIPKVEKERKKPDKKESIRRTNKTRSTRRVSSTQRTKQIPKEVREVGEEVGAPQQQHVHTAPPQTQQMQQYTPPVQVQDSSQFHFMPSPVQARKVTHESMVQADFIASPIPQHYSHEVSVAASQTMLPPAFHQEGTATRIVTHEHQVQANISPPRVNQSFQQTQTTPPKEDKTSAKHQLEKDDFTRDEKQESPVRTRRLITHESFVQTMTQESPPQQQKQVYSERVQTSPPFVEPATPAATPVKTVIKVVHHADVQTPGQDRSTVDIQTDSLAEYKEETATPPRIVKRTTEKFSSAVTENIEQPTPPSMIRDLMGNNDRKKDMTKPPVSTKKKMTKTDEHVSQRETPEIRSEPPPQQKSETVTVKIDPINTDLDVSELANMQTTVADIQKWRREKREMEELEARKEAKLRAPKDMLFLSDKKNDHTENDIDSSQVVNGIMYTNYDAPAKPPVGSSLQNLPPTLQEQALPAAENYEFTDTVEDKIRRKAHDTMESAISIVNQHVLDQYLREMIEAQQEQMKIEALQAKESEKIDSEMNSPLRGAIFSHELDTFCEEHNIDLDAHRETINQILEELMREQLEAKERPTVREIEAVEGVTLKEAEKEMDDGIMLLALLLTQFNFHDKREKKEEVSPVQEVEELSMSEISAADLSEKLSVFASPQNNVPEKSETSLVESKEDQKETIIAVSEHDKSTISSKSHTVPVKDITDEEVIQTEVQKLKENDSDEQQEEEHLHTWETQPAQASVFLMSDNVHGTRVELRPEVSTPRKTPIVVKKPATPIIPSVEHAEFGIQTHGLVTFENTTTQTSVKRMDSLSTQTKAKRTANVEISAHIEPPQTPKAASPPKPQTPPTKIFMRDANTSPIEELNQPREEIPSKTSARTKRSSVASQQEKKEPSISSKYPLDSEDQPIMNLGMHREIRATRVPASKPQKDYAHLLEKEAAKSVHLSLDSSTADSDIFSEVSNFQDVIRDVPPIDDIWREYERQNLPQILKEDKRALLSHIIKERQILKDSDEESLDYVSQDEDGDLIDRYIQGGGRGLQQTAFHQKPKHDKWHSDHEYSTATDTESETSMFSNLSHAPRNREDLIDALLKASMYEVGDDDSVLA